jgi:hypothetical protein
MAVLLSQLLVTSGLTALSVQGAHNARALAGQPLEVVEQNGVKVLRVVGEDTAAPVGHSKAGPGDTHNSSGDIGAKPTDLSGHGSAPIDSHGLKSGTYAESSAASARSHDPEHWLADLEHRLDPDEKAKLTKMARGKTPQQVRDMLGADLHAAHERLRLEVRLEQERAAVAVQSKERVADLRKQIADRGLMNDPDIRVIVEGITAQNRGERLPMLRTSSSPSSCELRPKERILRLRCSMVSKSTRSYARRLLKNGGPRTQVRSLAGSWTAPTGSTSNAVKSIWVRLFWDGANRERFRSVTPPILGSSSEHVAGEARQWPAPSFLDEEYYAG